jgi:hypothetical protein
MTARDCTASAVARRVVPAPPWLMFWLGTEIVWTIPRQAGHWWTIMLDLVGATPNPTPAIVGSDLLRIVDLVDLVPLLVIVAAVVTVFGASIRGRRLEATYRLRADSHSPTVAAVTEFARAQLPGIEIRANLNRTDIVAFAYSRGLRRPRLAVFAPLIPLWRENHAAGEAVVLHEINHCRQGDNVLLGAASPFSFVLRHWLALYVVAALIPIGSVWLADAIDFLGSVGSVGASHTITQFFTLVLPDLGLSLVSVAGLLFAAITMPIAGSWSAELNADHVAAVDTPTGMIDATRLISVRGGAAGFLLARLTHPPMALRRALLRVGPQTTAAAAIACYPLGWLVLLCWELISDNATWLQLHLSPNTILSDNAQAIVNWRDSLWPLWLAAGVYLALWPILRRPWSRAVAGIGPRDRS